MKKKTLVLASLLLFFYCYPQKLTITVRNVEPYKGNLMVAIYNSAETFLTKPITDTLINLSTVSDSTNIDFTNLETGTYAVSMYQDSDSNRELNTFLFGIPSERYGFSNNARGFMGPPSYTSCKFYLKTDTLIVIDLD